MSELSKKNTPDSLMGVASETILNKINQAKNAESDEDDNAVNAFTLCIAASKRAKQINNEMNEEVHKQIDELYELGLKKEDFRVEKGKLMRELTENFNPLKEAVQELYDGKTIIEE